MNRQWTGRAAEKARATIAARLPLPCFRGCGRPVTGREAWDLDHRLAHSEGGSLWEPSNWAASHASCNRAHGASITNQRRRGDRTRDWLTRG